ncbi:hypothetical protein SLI_2657 [Streptomyces lividans 1326]|uniref:Uncharacterized protein n=1 Tax=Streptomyces lividans 1326 TaxID=1200984 RepID=A0A7U9DQR6_STRLI|nr:hypothetical protein SLI_2657 [Streptomyces lividans 1326]
MDRRADPWRHSVAAQLCHRKHCRVVEVDGVHHVQLPDVLRDAEKLTLRLQHGKGRHPQTGLRLEVRAVDESGHLPIARQRHERGRVENEVVQDHPASLCCRANASRSLRPITALSSSSTSTPKFSAR